MYLDVIDFRNFYSEQLGRTVRREIRTTIARRWSSVGDQRILGFGYATPFLDPFRTDAERVFAFMPAQQGVVNWPSSDESATALVDEDALPLPDACLDRILVVHALEHSDRPRELLREFWRVLAPGGRILIVVPNRRGYLARVDRTPFGFGRPFSRGQLTSLLRETLFSPVSWGPALYMTPVPRFMSIELTHRLARVGALLSPAFAGAIYVEATKQMYQGVTESRRKRLANALKPVLVPAPSAMSLDPRKDQAG
ncbi:methyltransferase domain-containing protein [Coralliovum pocilloporae]|uniref:methyltransferase domain-containing protein n=1 Tax=Coralliovum pocilloporae TaxID=3066369 RepID=UPI003306C4E0